MTRYRYCSECGLQIEVTPENYSERNEVEWARRNYRDWQKATPMCGSWEECNKRRAERLEGLMVTAKVKRYMGAPKYSRFSEALRMTEEITQEDLERIPAVKVWGYQPTDDHKFLVAKGRVQYDYEPGFWLVLDGDRNLLPPVPTTEFLREYWIEGEGGW